MRDTTLFISAGERTGFTPSGQPKLGTVKHPKREISWAKLADRLQRFEETDDKGGHGFIVGGWFSCTRRKEEFLVERQLVTLDADFIPEWDLDSIEEAYEGIEMMAHTTWSHRPGNPRVRVAIPLTRPVDKKEYAAVARLLAARLDIEYFDPASFKFNQLMWMPSHPEDVDPLVWRTHGELVDPDDVLAEVEDWTDFGQIPHAEGEKQQRVAAGQAGDPYEKPGEIGVFNRLFTVPHAIERFELPYHMEEEDRYTYTEGSGFGGARIYHNYGEGCFMYSDHATDPAAGNHNAYDLVRIHLFGHEDKGYEGEWSKSPSQGFMSEMVLGLPEVTQALTEDEFEDLGPDETLESEDGEEGSKKPALTFEGIMGRIKGRSAPISMEDSRLYINSIVASKLSDREEDALAGVLCKALEYPTTKKSITEDIASTKRKMRNLIEDGDPVDLELELIEKVLDDWFGGGDYIKRYAREFWVYEGGVWGRREDEWVRGKMQQSFIALRTDKPEEAERHLAHVMEDMATSAATSKLWQMFCSHLAGLNDSRDPMALMDRDKPAVINCLSGHIEFNRKGQHRLTKHDPSLFLTAQVPLEYDPDADTSHWDAFCDLMFHESLEPDEMQRHLEEVGGYILQPRRDRASFFLMKGAAGAGKSTFGAIVNTLMRNGGVNRSIATLGRGDHDTAQLVGKLLLLDEDFEKGKLLPDGMIKQISELKQMTANPKYAGEYDFLCRAVPMVIANDWPRTKDHSEALERRLVAWDLPAIPKEAQDDDKQKALLSVGLPGVLARFVEGFARFMKRGDFDIPDECVTAARHWSLNTDVVKLFLDQTTVEDPDAWIERPHLYGCFKVWYREEIDNKVKHMPGKIEFFRRASGFWGEPHPRDGYPGWAGHRYVGPDEF